MEWRSIEYEQIIGELYIYVHTVSGFDISDISVEINMTFKCENCWLCEDLKVP